jgi:class I lanthipeptide synthase
MLTNYSHFQNYILRTPKKSLKFGFDLLLQDRLPMNKILEDANFREALYLASPELMKALKNYQNLEDSKKSKLERTLLKYLVRTASRCTPFGLFSGCAIGKIDTTTQVRNLKEIERYTSLDMDVLIEISKKLLGVDKIKKTTQFFPNSSLYRLGPNYRYIEYYIENNTKKYTLENVRNNYYLEKVLKFSIGGKNITEIVDFMWQISKKQDAKLTTNEFESFVDELISNQLLISEISPSITGSDYFEKLINHIKRTYPEHPNNQLLKNVNSSLKELDIAITNPVSNYEKIVKTISKLALSVRHAHYFQTDHSKNFEYNTLATKIPLKVLNAIEVLCKISSHSPRIYLERFKNAFVHRYGSREVPLSLLFDQEIGIKFHDNNDYNEFDLIADLHLGISMDTTPVLSSKDIVRFFQLKYEQVLSNGLKVIEITDSDIATLPDQEHKSLSNTFSALIEMYNCDDKELIFLSSAGGSTALNLIARFSQQSSEIATIVNQITKKEGAYNKDIILAEICHLPENRTANVLKSKVDRTYEIVYLSNSELPIKNQIFIHDLYVSVREGSIQLRSKRLNKQIIPILSNAHNFYDNSLPIYKFLCELQFQHKKESIGFSWPELFTNFKFLPRVQYKDIILSKAQWHIKYSEIASLSNLKKWRIKRKIPQFVQIIEHDNHLLINLDNSNCVEILKGHCKKNKEIRILEFLFSPKYGLKINDDFYANEYVLFYYKNNNEAA